MKKFLPILVFFFGLAIVSLAKPIPTYAACTLTATSPIEVNKRGTASVKGTVGADGYHFTAKNCVFSPKSCKPGDAANCSVSFSCSVPGTVEITAKDYGFLGITYDQCKRNITVRSVDLTRQTTCRQECLIVAETDEQDRFCGIKPSCDEAPVAGTQATTKEQCLAQGKSEAQCASLPSYHDPAAIRDAAQQRASGGNVGLPEGKDEVDLGFIKLSTNPAILAGQLLDFGLGLATLFAILFTIIGGYEVATSVGNPDQLEAGKKRITAAIAGLVFLLLAAILLNTIGCGLIGIGGEGKSIICQ